jgi:hypothetical protein
MTRARTLEIAAVLGCLTLAGTAGAVDKAACATSSERGQKLRDDGKYADARAEFLTCASDACPAMIRTDCADWLVQLEKTTPSIVVVARSADGHDATNASITLDDKPIAMDGRPITLDPGAHALHAKLADGTTIDDHVVVRAGEKNREVVLQPPAPKPTAQVTTTTTAAQPASEAPASKSYVPSIVLGAVGLVAMGSFVTFGLMGKSDLDGLRGSCAPYCAQSDLDAAKLKLTIADVSLGVGLAAFVAATVLLFVPKATQKATGTLHIEGARLVF